MINGAKKFDNVIPYAILFDRNFDKRRPHLIRLLHAEANSNDYKMIATYNMKTDTLTVYDASKTSLLATNLPSMLSDEKKEKWA